MTLSDIKKIAAAFVILLALPAKAETVIEVAPCAGDATPTLREAIATAAQYRGKPVTIRLVPGDYDISRQQSSLHLYHVSNTASADENPDQTKHIGLWFRDMSNVTLDGNGARIVTHGEMTPILLDRCNNIVLKNFTLTAADPSVPEFKVLNVDRKTMTVEVTPPSRFAIDSDGKFSFTGEGWSLSDGYAQVYYPESNVTLRCGSPLAGCLWARSLGGNIVQFGYDESPRVHAGEIYQLRHGTRNEVCGFFNLCKNISLENIEFNFLGNFGLVAQYSENLTYDNIRCRPSLGSGRTDAGFADFVQMSGCKGKLRIVNSHFEGAHDDPINIHGTHLKAIASDSPNNLTVRFMHGQTYGFTPFFRDDKVDIVDRHTLNCIVPAVVKNVKQLNDYDFELTLDRPVPLLPDGYTLDDVAVENVTWTPEVEIINNYFARIPTRGILITTRGKSLIQDNTFFRIPMPAILVSDDARGWYESGPVRDLTIRRNTFIECSSPVIAVSPEIDRFDKPVHTGITIDGNRFIMNGATGDIIRLNAAADVTVAENVFQLPGPSDATEAELIESDNTTGMTVRDNKIITSTNDPQR